MILLETLPGWPAAPQFSELSLILLMVVAPLAAVGLTTVLVFARSWARKD